MLQMHIQLFKSLLLNPQSGGSRVYICRLILFTNTHCSHPLRLTLMELFLFHLIFSYISAVQFPGESDLRPVGVGTLPPAVLVSYAIGQSPSPLPFLLSVPDGEAS